MASDINKDNLELGRSYMPAMVATAKKCVEDMRLSVSLPSDNHTTEAANFQQELEESMAQLYQT